MVSKRSKRQRAREIILSTVGLPFVFVVVLLLAVFMLVFGDPLEELMEDC